MKYTLWLLKDSIFYCLIIIIIHYWHSYEQKVGFSLLNIYGRTILIVCFCPLVLHVNYLIRDFNKTIFKTKKGYILKCEKKKYNLSKEYIVMVKYFKLHSFENTLKYWPTPFSGYYYCEILFSNNERVKISCLKINFLRKMEGISFEHESLFYPVW